MSSINDISNDVFNSLSSSQSSSSDSFHSTSLSSLNVTLDSHFSTCLKNFNVIHINAQSIPAHFPDMLASFESCNIHAILVSESWLKPCLPSSCYSLPGFQLIRNDRIGKGGGGVAIYLRSHISCSIVSSSIQPPPADSAEHLLIEVLMSHTRILLGVFYSPSPLNNYFISLENLLEEMLPLYSHSILMGDFNTCLLKDDTRSKKLLAITESCNLHILPLSATHVSPGCNPSLLDLIMVSSTDFVSKHGQCPADAFSFHDLIYLSYNIRPPKNKSRILLRRNFGGMDRNRLCDDANRIDWSPVVRADTIDSKVEIFNSMLEQLYDVHAPVKPIKMKHLPAPWITSEIRSLMERKNRTKHKFKLNDSDANREKYIKARNRCNTSCRDAQRRHIFNSVENGDTAKTWKFLESLGVGKSYQLTSSNIDVDLLNKHFTASNLIDTDCKKQTINALSLEPTSHSQPFYFSSFTECDVKRNIQSISSNAVGYDCISRNMITPILDIVCPILVHIFNFSISCGKFPEIWKNAQVIPLPKHGNPKSPSDFRPISILPFLSKIFEKLIHHQLSHYFSTNSLLSPFQSGFRIGHSTTTALVKVTDDIRWGMDNKKCTILTLLDFSNAFNNVDHDILLRLLYSFNISPSVLEWFHSYLKGRKQRIRMDEKFSSWCDVLAGVPQGGVLSPLLFSIFINSITRNISSLYHMYADDIQIYRQCNLEDLPDAISDVNNDLDAIYKWSQSFGISVNPIKSQVIIIGSPGITRRIDWPNVPSVTYNGVCIPYCNNVKNLGVYIDQNLSWSVHISHISKKTFLALKSLRRLRSVLPIPTKIMLANSLLLPILDYADASFTNLSEDQLNKLERIQNLAIRFIFSLRKYDHVSQYRSKLKWLSIRCRRNLRFLTFLYCVLFSPTAPSYLRDKFVFIKSPGNQVRPLRNLTLCIPVHKTKIYDQSFTVQCIKLWNNLPLNIRQAKSLLSFKKAVKYHFMTTS